MARDAAELVQRLARDAEAVCRHYLPHGRREGRYWFVGDVRDTPGRSMFVRLRGPDSGKGAPGRWRDAATGEYGDLLDVIRESCGLVDFRDVAEEARRFLNLPRSDRETFHRHVAPAAVVAHLGRELEAVHARHLDIADDDVEILARLVQIERAVGRFDGSSASTMRIFDSLSRANSSGSNGGRTVDMVARSSAGGATGTRGLARESLMSQVSSR